MREFKYVSHTKTRTALLSSMKDGRIYKSELLCSITGLSMSTITNCMAGMVSADIIENLSDSRIGMYRINKRGLAVLRGEQVLRPEHMSPATSEKVPVITELATPEPAKPPQNSTAHINIDIEAILAKVFDRVSVAYDEIIAELMERVDALEDVATAPATQPEPILLTPTHSKDHKPKVFLGGAKPSQAFIITKEFRDKFDMRCACSDDLNKWRSMAKHCDHVLAMRGFISHKHTEALQAEGKNIQFVNSMTDIRDVLAKLSNKEK